MKGLYFYKLVSPYQEDVTKDCKLTINEIDHNFKTLKDMDIKEISFDEKTNTISLIRTNGDTIYANLSSAIEGVAKNLKVDFDSKGGVITITYNDEEVKVSGIVTDENLVQKALTEVISDGTLSGLGSKGIPLGIAPVEKTGQYKPAIRLINKLEGEELPKCSLKGDRYVTKERVSKYGFLYTYANVEKINKDLKNGWRVPTKDDWDNMLNAIEPCDGDRDHNSPLGNQMFGKIAGKLLKSRNDWKEFREEVNVSCLCNEDENMKNSDSSDIFGGDNGEFDLIFGNEKTKPNRKFRTPVGVDSFGFGLVPSGFYDGCKLFGYFGTRGIYWSTRKDNETDNYVKRFDYNKAGVVQNLESPFSAFSLRLVKDYDGGNHKQVEYINGMNYSTVLLPTQNTPFGHSIWTATNIAFADDKYEPIEPNMGNLPKDAVYNVYYINEWNGFSWERKLMSEGETIVLFNGLNKDKNMEYMIINGELYCVADVIYDKVIEEVQKQLDDITNRLDSAEERLDAVENRLDEHDIKLEDLRTDLEQEITDRIEADNVINERIDDEIAAREEADRIINQRIDDEIAAREEADAALQEEIDTIEENVGLNPDGTMPILDGKFTSGSTTVINAIQKLDTALETEESNRIEGDEMLQLELDITQESVGLDEDGNYLPTDGHYTSEATTIAGAIDALDKALKVEETDRIEKDEQLQSELDKSQESVGLAEDGSYVKTDGNYTSEATTIAGAIDALDKALKAEETNRIEKDEQLQSELDKTQESVGLAEDGSYVKTDGHYTSEATTVTGAIDALDKALKVEETDRTNMDNYLNSRLIKAGEHPNGDPYVAFDCANGILTLQTEDPKNNVIIRLNGDYGVIPYTPLKK